MSRSASDSPGLLQLAMVFTAAAGIGVGVALWSKSKRSISVVFASGDKVAGVTMCLLFLLC